MKQILTFLTSSLFFLTFSTSLFAQNVGIGQAVPLSKLDVNGGLTVGGAYSGVSTAPADGAIIQGRLGVGTASPGYQLEVIGNAKILGDFVNQELIGANTGAIQNVPYNANAVPVNGSTVSISIVDGNGVNNSGVMIVGFVRAFSALTYTGSLSLGGYFLALQRAEDAAFTVNPTLLTYSSGSVGLRFPNGLATSTINFGDGTSISYTDLNLTAGVTYYYRLLMYGNTVGMSGGTIDLYERNLSVMQIKR